MSKKNIISKKRKQSNLPDENSNNSNDISNQYHSSDLGNVSPPTLQGEIHESQEAERIETHILTFLKYQYIRKNTQFSDASLNENPLASALPSPSPSKKANSSNPFTAAFSLSFLFENDCEVSSWHQEEEENPIWRSVVQLQMFLIANQDDYKLYHFQISYCKFGTSMDIEWWKSTASQVDMNRC